MKILTISYLNTDGKLSASCKDKISKEDLIKGYRAMVLTRHIDARMITLQRQGLITFALSSLGEEACAVATAAALDLEDWLYPQYREAGVMFWRGFTPERYLHQMFGDALDIIKGRQMPNHFGSREINVVHVSSPIATNIPHAAGAAYAMKLQKEKKVAVCFFGDGATSEGDFHVGLNFAAVRKVPAIFFCRNNQYAISTSVNEQFKSEGIYPKGAGYGVTTFRVDGNDYFAVHETVKKSREHCLKGKGPILIEAMTYRMGAHSTSDDPSRYRTDQEVKQWEEKCPIKRLRNYLEINHLWNENKEQELQKKIKKEVDDAIETAKNTSKPSLESMIEDVYYEVPNELKEQLGDIDA